MDGDEAAQHLLTESKRRKTIGRRGQKLAGLEPRPRHKLRIQAKTLRYACGFFAGLYGGTVALRGGGAAIAGDDFIRNSIVEPAAHAVAGYAPVMPSFAGQVDEEQIVALVAYIKSLGKPPR